MFCMYNCCLNKVHIVLLLKTASAALLLRLPRLHCYSASLAALLLGCSSCTATRLLRPYCCTATLLLWLHCYSAAPAALLLCFSNCTATPTALLLRCSSYTATPAVLAAPTILLLCCCCYKKVFLCLFPWRFLSGICFVK